MRHARLIVLEATIRQNRELLHINGENAIQERLTKGDIAIMMVALIVKHGLGDRHDVGKRFATFGSFHRLVIDGTMIKH